MIDLRNKELPNTITVNGSSFLIETDYRAWLKFGVLVEDNCDLSELVFLLKDTDIKDCLLWSVPTWNEMYKQMASFYSNPNSTPNQIGEVAGEKTIDFIEDGEYIYASFLYAYKIDLVETDLHWHKFKALFNGLPDTSKMVSIMNMRSYTTPTKTPDKIHMEAKQVWALKTKIDDKLIDELNEMFYNS